MKNKHDKFQWLQSLILLFILIIFNSSNAWAVDGDLDPNFGNGGKITTDFGNNDYEVPHDLILQPDGKILAVGSGGSYGNAIARYNIDGSLDTTFNGTGKITPNFGYNDDFASGVIIQPDGKILVLTEWWVARFNSDGSLDTSFGGTGKVETFLSAGTDTGGIALQTNGKIIVVGQDLNSGHGAILCFNSNGSLDTTFGMGGRSMMDLGTEDSASKVTIQPDGKILVTAFIIQRGPVDHFPSPFILARYNSNGTPDTSFGNQGKVLTVFDEAIASALDVTLQADGKIIAGGIAYYESGKSNPILVRYNTDGSLDNSFGNSGKLIDNSDNRFNNILLQPDGKIVAMGPMVIRYNSDGSLDSNFGIDGKVSVSGMSGASGGVLQPDGKIVMCSTTPDLKDFALVRLISSQSPQGQEDISKAGGCSLTVGVNPKGNLSFIMFALGLVTLLARRLINSYRKTLPIN